MVLSAKEIASDEDMGAAREPRVVVFKDQKCVVQKVHITGMKKTKGDYVIDDVKGLLDATSIIGVYRQALDCRKKLMSKGIFDKVEIILDTTAHYEKNKIKNGIQVVFRVKERRNITGEVRTEMSNSDQPQWVLRILSPNVFGRGETISTAFSRKLGSESVTSQGFYTPSDFSLNAIKPFKGGSRFRMSLLQDLQECPWNSTNVTLRGGEIELQFPLLNNDHSLAWHGHWRELSSSNRATAFAIRDNFGHSLKSSILHSVLMDRTDDPILPKRGYLFKMAEEIAGLGGDVKMLKENIEAQFHKTFFGRLTFGLGLKTGFSIPFNNREIHIQDRFYIGGPLTLRGFELNRVGPQADGDFTGGSNYWVAGLHAYSPLPFYWKQFGSGSWLDGFRLHGFVNAGNLLYFDSSTPIRDQLPLLFQNVRTSYGIGLVYNFMHRARIELNFCVPKSVKPGDKACDGVQFGIGISSI